MTFKKTNIFVLMILLGFLTSCSSSNLSHTDKSANTGNQPTAEKNYRSFDSVDDLRDYLKWTPDRQPIVSAHRGGPMPGFPENCVETFENSLNYAPCLIECDIQMTRDSVMVMMHDDDLERTTTGSGLVSEHSLVEIKSLFLEDNAGAVTDYRVPTLMETIKWARDRSVIQLDIKRSLPLAKVIAFVEMHHAEHFVVIITYTLDAAQKVHELNPNLMISCTARNVVEVNRLLATGIPTDNLLAFVGVSEPKIVVYDRLHENGILAILGTMHNLDNRAKKKGDQVYVELVNNGADILATDRISAATVILSID